MEDLEQQVQVALESDAAAISERVRAATLQALSGGELNKETIKAVMDAVVKGVQQGAARHGNQAQALKQAMRGLDEALASAAEATQLTLQEAGSRGEAFSRQTLKQATDDLAVLEALFIETLGNAAKGANGIARATLQDIVEHGRTSGTAVGGRIESALSQLARTLANTAHEQLGAGTQVVRQEASLLAGLAAGVLRGMADRLHTVSTETKENTDEG